MTKWQFLIYVLGGLMPGLYGQEQWPGFDELAPEGRKEGFLLLNDRYFVVFDSWNDGRRLLVTLYIYDSDGRLAGMILMSRNPALVHGAVSEFKDRARKLRPGLWHLPGKAVLHVFSLSAGRVEDSVRVAMIYLPRLLRTDLGLDAYPQVSDRRILEAFENQEAHE